MGLKVNPPILKLSEYSLLDTDGIAMAKSHSYLAQSDGIVFAYCQITLVGDRFHGFVSRTVDASGEGARADVDYGHTANWDMKLKFSVVKNEYFEITTDSANTAVIMWRSIGSLKKPIDQD